MHYQEAETESEVWLKAGTLTNDGIKQLFNPQHHKDNPYGSVLNVEILGVGQEKAEVKADSWKRWQWAE